MSKNTAFYVVITGLILCVKMVWPDPFSADAVWRFAGQLLREGKYYRAVSEYKRFAFLYPRDKRTPRAHLQMAEALYLGQDYFSSLEKCQVHTWDTDHPLYYAYNRLAGLNHMRLGQYVAAWRKFDMLERKKPSFDNALLALCAASHEARELAEKKIRYIKTRYPKQAQKAAFLSLVKLIRTPVEKRSQAFAVFISLIFPGFGHFYANDPQTGVLALATNLLFAGLTVTGIVFGVYPYVALCGLLFASFYSNNIRMAAYKTAIKNAESVAKKEKRINSLCFMIAKNG